MGAWIPTPDVDGAPEDAFKSLVHLYPRNVPSNPPTVLGDHNGHIFVPVIMDGAAG